MRADIVNRIYFEFEPEEGLEIYSSLPARTGDGARWEDLSPSFMA